MARNHAARKSAKAIRRKMAVTAKRAAEAAASSPAGQVRQGAGLPVQQCLVSDGLFDCGMGTITLMRGTSPEYRYVAIFMLDAFCLGVKDSFFRVMDRQEADETLDRLELSGPSSSVAPAEARKLLRDVVAWARSNGFPPHKDYVRVEALFGDVAPAATDYTPRFGEDGRVLYLPGPTESFSQVRSRLNQMRSRFGDMAAVDTVLSIASLLKDGPGYHLDGEIESEPEDETALALEADEK